MQRTDNKLEQEETLLKYIDIPYFRNNPAYIDRWREYYQRYKDPQILLLMYHKQIGTYFHWIYLELSEHFLRVQQPEIAHFILSEALRIKVYDGTRIKNALAQIPKFDRKYSKGDLLALLNQRNITALGRVWNSFEEEFVYELHLPQGFPNFELMKLHHYESRYGVAYNVPEKADVGNSMIEIPNAGFFSRTFVNGSLTVESHAIPRDIDVEAAKQIANCDNPCITQNVDIANHPHGPVKVGSRDLIEIHKNSENMQNNSLKCTIGIQEQHQDFIPEPSSRCTSIEIVETGHVLCENLPNQPVKKSSKEPVQQEDETNGKDLHLLTHELELGSLPIDESDAGQKEDSRHCPPHPTIVDVRNSVMRFTKDSYCQENMEIMMKDCQNGCTEYPDPSNENALEHNSIHTRSHADEAGQPEVNLTLERDLPGQDCSKKLCIDPIEPRLDSSQDEKSCSSQVGLLSSSFVGTQETEIQNVDPGARAKKYREEPDSIRSIFEPGFLQISGNLAPDSEIIIDRYIYLVQEAEVGGFSLLRIAKDLDITQTIIGKYFLLRKATQQNAKVSKRLFNYECCEHEGNHFVLYEHSRIAHLSSILLNANPIVCLFYLKKVVEKLLSLRENGFIYSSPENFFVDQDFGVVFNSFDFEPDSEESLRRIELELQRVFRNRDAQLSYEFLSLADEKLSLSSSKKDVLKHKTELLEDF